MILKKLHGPIVHWINGFGPIVHLDKWFLDKWYFWTKGFWTNGTFGQKAYGQMVLWTKGFWTNGTFGQTVFGQMVLWTNGLLGKWYFGQTVFGQIVLDKWYFNKCLLDKQCGTIQKALEISTNSVTGSKSICIAISFQKWS